MLNSDIFIIAKKLGGYAKSTKKFIKSSEKIWLFQNKPRTSRCVYDISTSTTTKIEDMKKSSILKYTSKFINKNFRLKVYGVDGEGNRINKLVGVAGLIALIGIELLNKFIDRALKAGLDKCVCKLRRGLQVSLYNK